MGVSEAVGVAVGVKVGQGVWLGPVVGVVVAVGAVGVTVKEGSGVLVMVGVGVGPGAKRVGYAAIRKTRVRMKIEMMTRLVSRKRVRAVFSGSSAIANQRLS